VFVVGDKSELDECLQSLADQDHTDVFLVEPFYDVEVSPNIGMFIDPRDGSIVCISVCDQIMDGQVRHIGNRFPSEAQRVLEMVDAAYRACCWLRDRGTTGFLGFDFCEHRVPGGNERAFFFAELNPRFNGATYPAHVMSRLHARNTAQGAPYRVCRAETVRTNIRSFPEFYGRFRDLLFDGRASAGVIPYNVGMLQHGKIMLAIIGVTGQETEAVYTELCGRNHQTPPHPMAA
jgi:hypothetical protein